MLGAGASEKPRLQPCRDLILALIGMAPAKVLPHQLDASLMELQSGAKTHRSVVRESGHGRSIIPGKTAPTRPRQAPSTDGARIGPPAAVGINSRLLLSDCRFHSNS